jgi:EpsI family protein
LEPEGSSVNFLNNKYTGAVTLILLLQAVAYYALAAHKEVTPNVGPLSTFPLVVDQWQTVHEIPLEKEVQDVLKADDTMNREYRSPSLANSAWLFVAFFKTQRYGQAPHSPKNCLPGSGWEPTENTNIAIKVANWPAPIVTNKYVVSHGTEKSVVMYWYQSHNRVIASEYWAKFWLVADAIRYHRSDTALVRVVVPVQNDDINGATQTAISFIQAMFPKLLTQLSI